MFADKKSEQNALDDPNSNCEMQPDVSDAQLKQDALDYHQNPCPGKIATEITVPVDSQYDLSLAYSPGVAEPVRKIAQDPEAIYRYTRKGNLVAVISDGSAILGLGALGPAASKPVMEGKSLLFKHLAGIDAVDIEVNAESPQAFVDTVRRIAGTYAGINLEDIKAPECFEIERQLIDLCCNKNHSEKNKNKDPVPIFHDDQHGTAIVTVAGILNALEIQGKSPKSARLVCLGAGAAAIACCRLLLKKGIRLENITMLDRKGVIYVGREGLVEKHKAVFAQDTDKRTLKQAIEGADIFLGLSGPNLLSPELLATMAERPIVFACSNPDPEIKPELALEARDDVIIATGRSDYPNQINNVLGFPFIFRGALDVRATIINDEMKLAAAEALRTLAKAPVPESILKAYCVDKMEFGRDYIIPRPMDPRLLGTVSSAVAMAAVESGVARVNYPTNYPLESAADIRW